MMAGFSILIASFLVVAGVRIFSVIVARLVGYFVPSTSDVCSRFIAGWRKKRGIKNPLIRGTLCLAGALFVAVNIWGAPETRNIRRRITESTRLVVWPGGNGHRREHVLFETKDADAIKRFAGLVSLDFSLGILHEICACEGEMTFDFYRDQELHYSFSLHHGASIRVKDWDSGNKDLTWRSRWSLESWLSEVGASQALDGFIKQDRERRMEKIREKAELHREPAPPGG